MPLSTEQREDFIQRCITDMNKRGKINLFDIADEPISYAEELRNEFWSITQELVKRFNYEYLDQNNDGYFLRERFPNEKTDAFNITGDGNTVIQSSSDDNILISPAIQKNITPKQIKKTKNPLLEKASWVAGIIAFLIVAIEFIRNFFFR